MPAFVMKRNQKGGVNDMFYKALGFVVWRLAVAYMRQRFARYAKGAAVAGVLALGLAAYLGTRSGSEG
jgi:hypothetical protein